MMLSGPIIQNKNFTTSTKIVPAVQLHAEDHLWRWRVVRSQSYKSCSVSSSYRVLSKWYPVIKQSYQDPTRTAVRHDVSSAFRLGSRWMEYQGAKDWDGLLDPLDDKLRGEILRYGYLVEAAYRSFDFDPSSPTYGSTLRFLEQEELLAESGFPAGTGYRITRSLRATSSIQMPRWAAMAPSWAVIQSSWIGYVAVCQDEKEIARLGRRDVVIAFRGTATCLEWLENLRATLTDLPYNTESDDADDCRPMVESGFLSLYTSSATQCPSLQDMLRREVFRILENYKGEQLSFTVTGHSLGAALATLAAYDIKKAFKQAPLVTVISFGGPRVGNRSFRCQLEKQGVKVLRIVNPDDVITKVPGFLIDNNHDDDQDSSGALQQQDASAGYWGSWGSWLRRPMMADKQMAYCEVGCELRLMSPVRDQSPMNNLNVAKCHDLKTYLHLVESFVGSNCPLRKTARRLLKKERPTIKLTL